MFSNLGITARIARPVGRGLGRETVTRTSRGMAMATETMGEGETENGINKIYTENQSEMGAGEEEGLAGVDPDRLLRKATVGELITGGPTVGRACWRSVVARVIWATLG